MKSAWVLPLLLAGTVVAGEIEIIHSPVPTARHATDHDSMEAALERARVTMDRLRKERGATLDVEEHTVELKWPVRQAIIVADPEIQFAPFFLDQDTTANNLLDWNCGDRTYDGHNGVDINMAPFPWYKMRKDHGIVIAAADGMIVDKVEDQPEDSCEANTNDGDNNLLLIQHEDGSLGVYAHMRTDSLNKKGIGETVRAGEYLGVIGSAGISTGPHLHFGVGFFETEGNVTRFVEQDPWAGACNDINDDGWWETQPPYNIPALLSIATHSGVWQFRNCPQSAKPNYSNSFSAGDELWFSATIRDRLAGMAADVAIKQPNGVALVETQILDAQDVPGAVISGGGIFLPNNAPAGAWTLEVTFDGETHVHTFYVDADPPAPDPIPQNNNQYNGLWYDPALDGEGYNIVTTPNGTVIYFYGSDEDGERLWMISETIKERFRAGQAMDIVMYESTGGIFDEPVRSARGLSVWGNLNLEFDDCNGGTAVLRGEDGEKTSAIIKLAGVPGTGCINGDRPDAVQAGLWFNPDLDGEGFNLIVAPNGVVIYYYGFDADGQRLWLITSTITDEDITDGAGHTATLFRADSGTFDAPVPSAQSLVDFGDLTIRVSGCNSMDYEMITDDGNKNTGTVRLAGVLGLDC